MTEEQIVRTVVEKPNSLEFGPAQNRFKLYFNEAVDLLQKVKDLRSLGFDVPITAGL
jgi:hypothetical protein